MNTRLVKSVVFFAAMTMLPAAESVEPELERARDHQDRAALERMIQARKSAAEKAPKDAHARYLLALAQSYLAQVAIEIQDKAQAGAAAEEGIRAARAAVALKPEIAEHHRILGTLCGQVIPANLLAGFKYGRCALDSVNKAIEIDPRSSSAYLSRGVGYYYLPSSFGGGVDRAIEDLRKAIEINSSNADAHLWLGVALRKANRNREARLAIRKSLELNPGRAWAKQQLEKTPAQ